MCIFGYRVRYETWLFTKSLYDVTPTHHQSKFQNGTAYRYVVVFVRRLDFPLVRLVVKFRIGVLEGLQSFGG